MKALSPLGWILCVVLSSCLLGCKSDSGKPRVAFVSNNAESFWNIAEKGAKKAANEFGVELYFLKPSRSDPAEQKEKIDQVLNQGIKAVAISVVEPEKQLDYLRSIAKKVALLTQDNDAPDSGRLCYIGTDNYEAGRAAGALVKQALPEGGTVVIFVGDLAALNARQRQAGVIDELAEKKGSPTADGTKAGKYLIKKTYTDQPDGPSKAKTNAVAAINDLGENEKNVCFVGLWAYNPPAIISAVSDKGLLGKIKIVGFDEEPETLNAIKRGEVVGTIVQQPYEFGYQSVKLMSEIAQGEKKNLPSSGILHVPHLAVTKEGKEVSTFDGQKTKGDTAEAFHKKLNKLLDKE